MQNKKYYICNNSNNKSNKKGAIGNWENWKLIKYQISKGKIAIRSLHSIIETMMVNCNVNFNKKTPPQGKKMEL